MCTYSTGSRIGFFLVKSIKNKNNTIKKEKENMRLNKKSGFTLLEIIIVIIIIGVLAALALPQFIKTVEFSKGAEALANYATLRSSMARYNLRNSNSYSGASLTAINLDVTNPSFNAGAGVANSHFDYAFSPADPVTTTNAYTIVATRSTYDGGNAGSSITFSEATNGVITKSGATAFAGI